MTDSVKDRLIRTSTMAAALLLAGVGPAPAQDGADVENSVPAADGPHLPADSMELGETYMDYVLDYDASSLWDVLTEDARERLGSVGDLRDQMGQIFRRIGSQERVVDQRYWMREGKPQYWHTAEFSEMPEPMVFRFVIEPDGSISGLGLNPQSQNPPVDDPNQHGDVDDADTAGGG